VGLTRSADAHRAALIEIFHAALDAVRGDRSVREYLRTGQLRAPIFVIAIGKAAVAMARGAFEALGNAVGDALIITKRGYAEPLPYTVIESAHPVPDESSLEAGERLFQFVSAIPRHAQVVVLLSGGGSALVERLPVGVTLEQWRELNQWLLASGLDIVAMNHIRKRVSLIKGGRLAAALAPRPVMCLAISDVPGDDPRAIASGPLVADSVSQLPKDVSWPPWVRELLDAAPPPPAPEDPCFANVHVHLVGKLDVALQAAAVAATRLDYSALHNTEFISGDAITAGQRLAKAAIEVPPGQVLVWGGETTIRLPAAPGRGGRNQSLALSAALAIEGRNDVLLLAAGTDGTDGPTEDAGALVDGFTVARGREAGFDARESLELADAGTFLEASGDLIRTGPTGTNVMDIMLGVKYSDR
jgi:hydroxypyruvate reductase